MKWYAIMLNIIIKHTRMFTYITYISHQRASYAVLQRVCHRRNDKILGKT